MTLAPTPGQTIGPFFGYALPYDAGPMLVPADRADAIRLHGRVLDGAGEPVPDALLEVSQTSGDGAPLWGRAATDQDGHYSFTTVLPTAYFAVTLFARGLLDRLFTRVYLPGADDPLLAALPADRRATLVATQDGTGYQFDIRLQGERETVFLAYPRD
jgi:protocatechuate 3,4-dioxygenase alpha subunit